MNRSKHIFFQLAVILVTPVSFADPLDDVIATGFEKVFASAVVLSDSDVIKFGLNNFNPQTYVDLDSLDLGTEASLQARSEKSVFTLPYLLSLSDEDTNRHQLYFRLSRITSDAERTLWSADQPADRLQETTFGLFVAYRYQIQLDENWRLTPGIGSHLLYYQNDFTANSDFSKIIEPVLDGRMVNTSAWANIYEPQVKLRYDEQVDWGKWNVSSTMHYFSGFGGGQANNGKVGNPEGWYVTNRVEGFYQISQWSDTRQWLFGGLSRVDLGGDAVADLGSNYYYEFSFGWLTSPPLLKELVDNVGLGINLNYGSSLEGASIILMFNQD